MRKTSAALVIALLFPACKDQVAGPSGGQNPGAGATGLYVLNEGNFGLLEATLSFYDFNEDTVYLDLFGNANGGASLGSLGDDLKYLEGKLYVLMSGSENLTVISSDDYRLIQTASYPGAVPHDMVMDPARNRIYVTQLFSDAILVADLTTLAHVADFPVGTNPQGMALVGDRLFVCNSGFGTDTTVSVVNLQTGMVETVLPVGHGPSGAVLGTDGLLWILCTGDMFGSPPTNGSVYAINPVTLTVEQTVMFSENLWGGGIAAGNDGNIYVLGVTSGSFYGGPVHRIITSFPTSTEMNYIPGIFYSIAIDSSTGRLYLTDVHDFQTDGDVGIYESDGTLIKTFAAQKGPAAMAFKRE